MIPGITLMILVLYFSCTGLIVGLFFFSDIEHNGLKGVVSRFFLIEIPLFMKGILSAVFGNKFTARVVGCLNWIAYERNPLLQILYHIILFGAFNAWLYYGEHLLPTYLVHTPPHSKYEAHVGVGLCLFTWVMANFNGPGKITKENLNCYTHQHYDQLIFTDDVICGTCNIQKPARSKHCSMCGHCVPMFDHHCIWLNQCVGEQNHRWFLLFLVTHGTVFLYFGYLVTSVVMSPVVEHRMWEMTYTSPDTGQTWGGYQLIFSYLVNHSTALVTLAIVCVAFGMCIVGFLGYHLYLLGKGMTTNESYKWSACYRLYEQLTRCHQNYLDAVAQGYEFTPVPLEGEEEEEEQKEQQQQQAIQEQEQEQEGGKSSAHWGQGGGGYDTSVRESYGKVQRDSSGPDRRHFLRQMVEQDELPYYLMIDPGDRPANSYNQGFWRNLHTAMFPPSDLLLQKLFAEQQKEKEKEKGGDDAAVVGAVGAGGSEDNNLRKRNSSGTSDNNSKKDKKGKGKKGKR